VTGPTRTSEPAAYSLRSQFASIVAGDAARDRRAGPDAQRLSFQPDFLTTMAMHDETLDPVQRSMPRRRSSPLQVPDEPPAEERAAARKAARRIFRLYCVACGRSTESTVAARPSLRCSHCGGTMLLELSPD
jgi:DNA-directed RNA polymerase subunit RPC12/RpoP